MKILKIIVFGFLIFISNSIFAQVAVNINVGKSPVWGPVGYSDVDYYYLPDVSSYYDIRASQFIFLNNGVWVRSNHLPNRYRNYDLYRGHKIILNNYHGSRPYNSYKHHKGKYPKRYKWNQQKSIGNRSYNHSNHNDNGHKEGKGNKGHGKNK